MGMLFFHLDFLYAFIVTDLENGSYKIRNESLRDNMFFYAAEKYLQIRALNEPDVIHENFIAEITKNYDDTYSIKYPNGYLCREGPNLLATCDENFQKWTIEDIHGSLRLKINGACVTISRSTNVMFYDPHNFIIPTLESCATAKNTALEFRLIGKTKVQNPIEDFLRMKSGGSFLKRQYLTSNGGGDCDAEPAKKIVNLNSGFTIESDKPINETKGSQDVNLNSKIDIQTKNAGNKNTTTDIISTTPAIKSTTTDIVSTTPDDKNKNTDAQNVKADDKSTATDNKPDEKSNEENKLGSSHKEGKSFVNKLGSFLNKFKKTVADTVSLRQKVKKQVAEIKKLADKKIDDDIQKDADETGLAEDVLESESVLDSLKSKFDASQGINNGNKGSIVYKQKYPRELTENGAPKVEIQKIILDRDNDDPQTVSIEPLKVNGVDHTKYKVSD